MTSYAWPLGNLRGRANCSAVVAGGIYVPSYDQFLAFLYPGTGTAMSTTSSPFTAVGLTGVGVIDVVADASQGTYQLSSDQQIAHQTSSGAAVVCPLPSGKFFRSLATNGTGVYVTSGLDGSVQAYSAPINVLHNTPVAVGTFGSEVTDTAFSSGVIYAAMPSTSQLGILTVSTETSANIAAPMAYPLLVAVGASGVALAGWSPAAVASGVSAVALSPVASGLAALALPGSNQIALASGTDLLLLPAAFSSGATAPSALEWTETGQQLLVSGSGSVYVFNLTTGVLAISQTLTVAGAGNLDITPDETMALVCQESAGTVTALLNTLETWSVSASFSVPGAASVSIAADNLAYAVGSSGLSTLDRVGNVWSVASTVSLGFTPTDICPVGSAQCFVSGTASGQGFIAATASGSIVASGSWTGSGDAVVFHRNQAAVLDISNDLIHYFCLIGGVLYSVGTQSVPSGTTGLQITGSTSWLLSSTGASQIFFNTPGKYIPVRRGFISLYTGSTWSSVATNDHTPSALHFDASGVLWAATQQNDLYECGLSGGLTVAAQSVIPPYTGQGAGVTLGISSLASFDGHLYGTTLHSGSVVELV